MKKCLFLLIGFAFPLHVAMASEPLGLISFADPDKSLFPAWVKSAEYEKGTMVPSVGWVVDDQPSSQNAKLILSLDRTVLEDDIAIAICGTAGEDADFIVQLLDDANEVINADLYGNVINLAEARPVNTIVVPLKKHGAATQICLKSVRGGFQLRQLILYPVLTATNRYAVALDTTEDCISAPPPEQPAAITMVSGNTVSHDLPSPLPVMSAASTPAGMRDSQIDYSCVALIYKKDGINIFLDSEKNSTTNPAMLDIEKVFIEKLTDTSFRVLVMLNRNLSDSFSAADSVLFHLDVDVDRDVSTGYSFYGYGVDLFISYQKNAGETSGGIGAHAVNDIADDARLENVKMTEHAVSYTVVSDKILKRGGFNFAMRAVVNETIWDSMPVYSVDLRRFQARRDN